MKLKLLHRSMPIIALFCLLAVALAGCSRRPAADTGAYWPTQDWRTSSPAEQGMEAQKLTQMLAEIKNLHLKLDSLLIIRHGYIVSETYFGSTHQDTRHELYSVTKSFVATLIGIAWDQGYIDSLRHQTLDYFPGQTFSNVEERKESMTLEDVLTMRTGLVWSEGDAAYQGLYTSSDWVQYMLDKPMAQQPGSQFNYCSGCSHLLSAIVQQTTGMNPRDYAEKNLFKPLGIENADWETNPAGLPIGGWGLQLTPREMAKLGYLYLHEGQWDGQQVVSAEWVEAATQSHTGTDSLLSYGYQWWVIPSLKAYAALGLYGQTIMVIPGSDLVIVTTAHMTGHDMVYWLVEHFILPAVQK